MTNEDKAPEPDETAAAAETEDVAPAEDEPLRLSKSAEKSLEQKIDLLVNVAMLTIMTLMRLVKEKGPEAIGEAEMAQFDKVRESVQMAADAVEEWSKEGDSEGQPIDLSKMRAKLALLQQRIDEWPLDQADLDSTPPS